jgi:hypothetical protein
MLKNYCRRTCRRQHCKPLHAAYGVYDSGILQTTVVIKEQAAALFVYN